MTPITRLLSYLRRVPESYLLGAALTVLYSVCFQLVPLSVRGLVGHIESPTPQSSLALGALWVIGAALLLAVFRMASRMVLFRTAREIEYQIRNDLFRHLQTLPQSFFARNRTGDLMSRGVNDINSIRLFLGMGLMNIFQTPVLVLGALSVMAWVDWRLTLAVAIPYPIFTFVVRLYGRRLHAASLATQEQLGAVSTTVQENAAGVLVARAYHMEDRERERFETENQGLYSRHMRLAIVQGLMQPTIGMLPAIALLMVLLVGSWRVEAGALSLKDLWLFYIYVMMLTFPTFMLGWVFALAQRGLASLQRLGEVLDRVPSIRDRSDVEPMEGVLGRVQVEDLSFVYPDRELKSLSGIHFRASPGQTIGIVGRVGSGKSTLVNLIPRVLEVPDGAIFMDGVDVNRVPLLALRSSIAMVPQESFLFSATLAENIRFGCPDAPLEEVRDAARRAHLLDEIEDLPFGLDTPVGERGITLSGGQRQRVALARALILDPTILILDDALSSVDAMTEESILKDLRRAREGRTCFIVAHRLTAIRDADYILVLEEGQLAEEGTHAELLRKGGAYAEIHKQQQLEAEIEAGT